jgi:hypothetical protein
MLTQDINFLDLKQFPGGKLAYTGSTNNLFELLDSNLDQIAMIDSKGVEKVDPSREFLMCSSSPKIDEYIFLWTAGAGYIGVMDIYSMEFEMVEGLGGHGAGQSLPVALLSHHHGRKIITLTTNRADHAYYFHYWQNSYGKKVITRPLEAVDPEVHKIDTLEQTLDGTVAIASGSGEKKGILLAFSFDGYFDKISTLEYDDEICKVRRLPKKDVFLVGSWGTLYVVECKQGILFKATSINDVCSGLIAFIEIGGRDIHIMEDEGKEYRRLRIDADYID